MNGHHPDAATAEVEFQRFAFEGQAFGRWKKKMVFAWGGLPGETALVRVTRRKRRRLDGVVQQVLVPSAERVAPREDHFLSCSPWQILDPAREAHYKADAVRRLFEQRHEISLPQFDLIDGAPFGYRNKLEFSFTQTATGLSLAFYRRGGHREKTPIDGCLLGCEPLNVVARAFTEALNAAGIVAESLKTLMVRCSRAGHVTAALFLRERIAADRLRALDECLRGRLSHRGERSDAAAGASSEADCGADGGGRDVRTGRGEASAAATLIGWRAYFSDPQSPASVATEALYGWGEDVLEERLNTARLRFSTRSFFQVNVPVFEEALREIAGHVLPGLPVVDVFCGVGTLGIAVGREGTVFVESDPECVRFIEENCRINGLRDFRVVAGPAEKTLPPIPAESTVLLDPPRAGCHPKLLRQLAQ
ncbi:MAG: class I SAM-dependent RNA methyltransferase, partial [Planctomycetota bacterium]